MQKKDMPIGFFDSGIGGLSVLAHAARELPHENFIYYGDNKNAPYGIKSEKEIQELSLKCGEFLYQKGVKAIVMACNTATSAAVIRMREKYKMPVISIEPAVKPAILARETGNVAVMATPATLGQERYRLLLKRLECLNRVINIPCAGLVELIETRDFNNPALGEYLREKLTPLIGQDVYGIVMGCTHYSFIAEKIKAEAEALFGHGVEIFDGMYGMTRQLKRVLEQNGLLRESGERRIAYYSSGGEETARTFPALVEGR